MKRKSARKENEVADEVKQVKQDDGKIRFINNGGVLTLPNGKLVKNGETFKAMSYEVPQSIRDIVKPLDPEKADKLKAVIPTYSLQLVNEEEELYNVVDTRGKAINETPLDEEAANAFLNRLME